MVDDAVDETVVVAATRATAASLADVAINAMRGRYVTVETLDTGRTVEISLHASPVR